MTVSRPVGRLDRDDLLGEDARLGGGDGALVAAQREGVLVLAADPVALGDVLAGLAHRLGRDAELGHPRVDQAPAQGRVVHRLRRLAGGRARAWPTTQGARLIDSTPPAR